VILGRIVGPVCVDNIETVVDMVRVVLVNWDDCALIVICVAVMTLEVDVIGLEVECTDETIVESNAVVLGFVTVISAGEFVNRFSIELE